MDEARFVRASQLRGLIRELEHEQKDIADFDGDLYGFLHDNPRLSKHPAVYVFIKLIAMSVIEELEPLKKEFDSL